MSWGNPYAPPKAKTANFLPLRGTRRGNAIGFIAVSALACGLWIFSPDPAVKEAHLLCQGALSSEAYPSINACSADQRFKSGECACFRPNSTWGKAYSYLVPALATVLASAIFSGSLLLRLMLLNCAIALALFCDFVYATIVDPAAIEAAFALPLLLGSFCGIGTALFLLIDGVRRWFVQKTKRSRSRSD